MGSETTNEKISGYLEKKGKIRVVGGWKKYWFVLESRLLLYYRSKEEYEAISPCKGSISLGPPCSIKPALASTCIFQIESRSNTIILRAENRLEQDKWMQAILGALNLKPNSPTRMSLFRYSADDLAKTAALTNGPAKKHRAHLFSRQNTMPTSRAPTKKESPDKSKLSVLEKLRKMRSGSYVARSLENVNKAAPKASPKLPKSQNLQRMLLNSSAQSLNANSETLLVDKQEARKDGEDAAKATFVPTAVVLVNTVEYCTPNEITDTVIYTEPTVRVITPTKTDHNKNSVLIENTEYEPYTCRDSFLTVQPEENVYDECQYAKRSSTDKLYSTIDDPYAVPQLPPRVKSSSTEQLALRTEPKKAPLKRRGGTFSRITDFVSIDGQKKSSDDAIRCSSRGAKLGRKRSFVNRVLSKIGANKSVGEENHLARMDEEEERDRQRIPEAEMLREMRGVLSQRRQELDRIMPSGSNADLSQEKSSIEVTVEAETSLPGEKVFNYEFDEHAYYEPTFQKPKDFRPDLPPRQKLTDNYYHNHPCTPLPTEPFCMPRLKLKRPRSIQKLDQPQKLKTIDELLDDLDKEKSRNQSSMEHSTQYLNILIDETLISDICDDKNRSKSADELTTLRTDFVGRRKIEGAFDFRYSDELNSLLEELCKVTNAPILNTNATSSLVYHSETSDEWIKMIPVRKRTYSDPDYDVPRPHSSPMFANHQPIPLHALQKENAYNKQTAIGIPSPIIKEINPSSIEEDRSVTSYTSHQYAKELPVFKTTQKLIDSNQITKIAEDLKQVTISSDDYDSTDVELQEINQKQLSDKSVLFPTKKYEIECHVLVEDYTYASPRSFVSFDHMVNECEHTLQMKTAIVAAVCADDRGEKGAGDCGEDEVFADSLEPFDLEQISTEF